MTAEEATALSSQALREVQDQKLWLAGGGLERGDRPLDLAAAGQSGNASLGSSEVNRSVFCSQKCSVAHPVPG